MRDTDERGFTLVEVLVTMGIVLTLAALFVPVASRIRLSAEDVKCGSNLRQIGLGILQYAQDHDGTLPGPLTNFQLGYNWDPNSQLASILADYMPIIKPSSKRGTDVFVCPAFRRLKYTFNNTPVYQINVQVPMGESLKKEQPFGYPNSRFPQLFGAQPDFLPKRLADLAEIRDETGKPAAATTWMMKDIDQEDPFIAANMPAGNTKPPRTRVHGDHRNAIFFDFHMERTDWIKR